MNLTKEEAYIESIVDLVGHTLNEMHAPLNQSLLLNPDRTPLSSELYDLPKNENFVFPNSTHINNPS